MAGPSKKTKLEEMDDTEIANKRQSFLESKDKIELAISAARISLNKKITILQKLKESHINDSDDEKDQTDEVEHSEMFINKLQRSLTRIDVKIERYETEANNRLQKELLRRQQLVDNENEAKREQYEREREQEQEREREQE